MPSASTTTTSTANCTIVVDYYNNTCAHVTVNLPLTTTTVGVTKFSLELAVGYTAQDFSHVANILPNEITAGSSNTQGVHLVCGLTPLTPYSIRAIPYVSTGRGFKSNRATFTSLSDPFNNYWEPIVPRRLSLAGNLTPTPHSPTNKYTQTLAQTHTHRHPPTHAPPLLLYIFE